MDQAERVRLIRKDCEGRLLVTKSLFIDCRPLHSNNRSYYTLFREHEATEEYPMMKDLYLSSSDVTEYEQAILLLGNWRHWQELCSKSWFKEHLKYWREELEVKIRSTAISTLAKSDRTDAAKWIAEGKWQNKRGRPSKDEVEGIHRVHAGIGKEIDDLYESATKQERETRLN